MRRLLEVTLGLGLAWAARTAAAFVVPAAAPPPLTAPDLPVAPTAPALSSAVAAPPTPAAEPTATRREAPEPVGEAYDADAAMPPHATPVASYTLRASLDPAAHTLHGEGQIRWQNTSRTPQRELWVHLYLNAFKNQRSYFIRLPTGGFRGNGKLKDWGYIDVKRFAARELDGKDLWATADRSSAGDPEDETDIRVPLPRAVDPGDALTIDLAWDEHLPELVFRTGYEGSFYMVAQWFPKLARLEPDGRWAHFPFHHLSEFYADYGSYDVTIDTPESYIVGATGLMESEQKKGGRAERRFTQADVHDFSFTAWDRFEERRETTADGVSLRCLYPKGFDRAAAVELDTVRYGLDYFGKAFGRYPYATLTIVHPPDEATEAGGMEYPTLITTGGPWYQPYTGVRSPDIVTIHELGHQWFYGLVGTNENAFPFLDEGINSYAESDSMEARYPGSSAASALGISVSLPGAYRTASVERYRNAPVAQPASSFLSGSDYSALIYTRTATILHTLGHVYGEAEVRRAIGRYARRYRFEHPGPEELIAVFREVIGPDAADTLRAALFDRASVDYVVESISSESDVAPEGIFGDPAHPGIAPAPKEPAGYRGNAFVRRLGALRFPVDIDFISEDGETQRVRWEARESAARLPYAGKSKLAAVVIDPEHKVLLDENLLNNARRVSPLAVGPRILDRALFGVEAALATMLP